MFPPATKKEADALGWEELDVILVSGDAYVDSPLIGVAIIANVLMDAGYRVGVIPQPDVSSERDIKRLGEPKLFWGVTAGCVDSMVANYTASMKKRRHDDMTPDRDDSKKTHREGKDDCSRTGNNQRPDRACVAYTNLIRRCFKNTKPIVLGGVEASLRRVAHYDYWSDKIRRSILFDSKADILVYGMGERTVLDLAAKLAAGEEWRDIRGICYKADEVPEHYVKLPTFDRVRDDDDAFIEMFDLVYRNCDSKTAKGLAQLNDSRWLIQNPLGNEMGLDDVYGLPYENEGHPFHAKQGKIRALDTIRFSIVSHRGCYGECNFCSIAVHQGRNVRCRSEKSILEEVKKLTKSPSFRGVIVDVGGPTANMYGFSCSIMEKKGGCEGKRCLFPNICANLPVGHGKLLELLKKIRSVPGVKRVFVASGVRHDLVLADSRHGDAYLRELTRHHVSGQLKVAPEHVSPKVLSLMGKPGRECLLDFRRKFMENREKTEKEVFLTYYLIAAHPGCDMKAMRELRLFCAEELGVFPEQTQIFTPTPSTWSTVMYKTGKNPWTNEKIFIERGLRGKNEQKKAISDNCRRSR